MEEEYPDTNEEFELMHAEEMEMLNEMDNDQYDVLQQLTRPKAKKSLDFNYTNVEVRAENSSIEVNDPLKYNSLVSQNEAEVLYISSTEKHVETDVLTQINNSQDPVNTETIIEALDAPQLTNKRTIEDLFGDIDDIIDFDDNHTSKKSKQDGLTEEEKQLFIIEKIVQERKRLQEAKILPRSNNANSRSARSDAVSLSRFVPRWNFMPLTDKKGERIYAKLHSEGDFENEISQLSNQNHSGNLLSVPFEQLEKMAHTQLENKWNKIEKTQQEASKPVEVQELEGELWVEKYKPRSYVDLLSDESTNRALLQWLKLWDKIVFNKETKVKSKPKDDFKGKNIKFNKKTGPVVIQDLDEYGRPFHKIALLCGPPGLGKTTLAHMIAQQAGYNVIEVNASDDRSPESFRTQLQAATQMKAVMGTDPKPNCLVLDEIDGAASMSIDVLLKFCLGKTTGRAKGTKIKKGNNDTSSILKRPIICICNDVYIPALRLLRQTAFVVHFPPTATSRLALRLCEVARMQSLKTDLGVMMALSEKTNNDIRACLALLQCLKANASNSIRLTQVHTASIGQKDMQKGLFTVWQEIFQIPKAKRKAFVDTVSRDSSQTRDPNLNYCEASVNKSALSERVSSVLSTVQGCGDYNRLAQGVFENYLNMKINDSSMVSVADGMAWFCNFDFIFTKINTTQNYVLYPYLSYPFVVWHLLFSSLTWPKLTYPFTSYEMSVKSQKCLQVVDDVLKCMVPSVRAYACREQLLLDILPLLIDIIVPNLRPVSVAMYNHSEKEELQHVVSVMIDYNLTYSQERSQEGSFNFNLDPNIEEVARMEGGKGCRLLGYAGRQLVAHQVELEKLRRAEASLYHGNKPNSQPVSTSTAGSTPKGKVKKPVNHLLKLTPKAIKKVEDLKTRDFFGRIVERPFLSDAMKVKSDEIVKSDIWYHFKEGFNNAVRRNITMADLY